MKFCTNEKTMTGKDWCHPFLDQLSDDYKYTDIVDVDESIFTYNN